MAFSKLFRANEVLSFGTLFNGAGEITVLEHGDVSTVVGEKRGDKTAVTLFVSSFEGEGGCISDKSRRVDQSQKGDKESEDGGVHFV